jgi:hypothetical protein
MLGSLPEDVIGGIVAATNLQTAISEEDLTSREQFHKDLEDCFVAREPSWRLYYERRSKQYSSRSDVEKTRIVTRPQLTRADQEGGRAGGSAGDTARRDGAHAALRRKRARRTGYPVFEARRRAVERRGAGHCPSVEVGSSLR